MIRAAELHDVVLDHRIHQPKQARGKPQPRQPSKQVTNSDKTAEAGVRLYERSCEMRITMLQAFSIPSVEVVDA
jgi:hypothetical protein